MSDHDPAPAHHADAHDAGHDSGHGDHGHDEGSLGPVDWPMWGAGVLGVVAAIVTTVAVVAATKFVFSA
jgi:hypothetical protein